MMTNANVDNLGSIGGDIGWKSLVVVVLLVIRYSNGGGGSLCW